MTDWKKGDYAVSPGVGLCRFVQDPSDGVHLEFIADYEHGVGITCAGHRLGGSIANLSSITTAEHFILSRAYTAMKARDEAKAEAARQDEIFKIHAAALKALKDAERTAAEIAKIRSAATSGDVA